MSTQASTPSRLADLIEKGGALSGFPWPEESGDYDMRIGRDGTWYYRGEPIGRKRLCQLFSTILQRDADGGYWLVTPVERGRITVDDAPFVAVEMSIGEGHGEGRKGEDRGQVLSFRTNLDHWVTADADHRISVVHDPDTGEPSPYIRFRDRLDALISRSVFYELADLAEEVETADGQRLVVRSGDEYFDLGPAE
ncbi:DUF1285 domain-containing protein [Hwanghaeella grinnelliae]|uniref:DUF1285 domain-containing protein n=2 Tax=Hwanghaeella grinnelliae TaxID=2500179 RepID=A0A3S3UPR6_9PROT|nr:DUF1285 domain-containing protein [Hwanghaeella grinnelliae]